MGNLGRNADQPAWTACILKADGTQSTANDANANINTATFTAVQFVTGSEVQDRENWHTSTNSERITPSGFQGTMAFYASAYVQWGLDATGVRRARLMKNGVTKICEEVQAAANINNGSTSLSEFVLLTPGDYITLEVTQNSGGALVLNTNTTLSLAALPS